MKVTPRLPAYYSLEVNSGTLGTEATPGSPADNTGMARDPVCGMEVDEKAALATSEYKGGTYYFCAPGCKKAFDADPEKYVAST